MDAGTGATGAAHAAGEMAASKNCYAEPQEAPAAKAKSDIATFSTTTKKDYIAYVASFTKIAVIAYTNSTG